MSADQHDKQNALIQAFHNGHYRQAQLLLESGMVVNYKDMHGESPLSKAIVASAEASMKKRLLLLLLASGADVNLPDQAGRTPVMHAVLQGELDSVTVLTTQGSWDAKAQDQDGNSALMHAAMLGRQDIARTLLNGLRNLQTLTCLGQKNAEGLNAEQLALVNGHYGVASFLSEHTRFFPDLQQEFADLKIDSEPTSSFVSVPGPPMDLIRVKEEHIVTGSHVLDIDSSPDAHLPSGTFHFLTIPAAEDKEIFNDGMELILRPKEALRRPRHSGLRLESLEEGYHGNLALDLTDTPIMGLQPGPPRMFAVRTTKIGLEPVATLLKAPRQLRKLIDKDKTSKSQSPIRSRPSSPVPSPTREYLPKVKPVSRAWTPDWEWESRSCSAPEPEVKKALLPLEPLCVKDTESKLSKRRKASVNSQCPFQINMLVAQDMQLVKSMPDVSQASNSVGATEVLAKDRDIGVRNPKVLSSSLPVLPLPSPPSSDVKTSMKPKDGGTLFLPYVRNMSHVAAEPKSTIYQLASSTLRGLGMSR